MNKQILILLFFVPSILFAQKTKKVVDKKTNEIFYVLRSDKKTKHGEYLMYSYNNQLLVKGYYKLGAKDSIWDCYDFNGQLTLKYDYAKNELVFYKLDDKVKDKKYRVYVNGNKVDTTLNRPPIFLGGEILRYETYKNIRYPIVAQENGKSGTVVVFFTVDKFGKTANYHIEEPIGYGMDEEAIRAIKLVPDDWLPGILNGQAVDVEIEFQINFRLNDR